jgi:hypothetical protein
LAYHLLPGERYTVLAAVGVNPNGSGDPIPAEPLLVAMPVTFAAPEDDTSLPRKEVAFMRLKPQPVQQFPPRPTQSAQQKWDLGCRFSGKPFNGLALEACALTPKELMVTLWNCGTKETRVWKWFDRSDYEILVRDAKGRFSQLTDKGKKFFQGGTLWKAKHLGQGETIKATLPIGELFDMRAPGEYTVLASLPVVGDRIDAVLTAAPVKIRIDSPKVQPQPKKLPARRATAIVVPRGLNVRLSSISLDDASSRPDTP